MRGGIASHARAQRATQFLRLRGIVDRDDARLKFLRLFEQQFEIVSRRQADELNLVGQILRNFDGAGADGTGAAKKNNFFHLRFTIFDGRAFGETSRFGGRNK